MSHTRTGMTACKKASPGMTVEVADEAILPVDGFGTNEVDLDQPGSAIKPVKMVAVGCVPGRSRNLLSTLKTVKQWVIRFSATNRRLFWGSRGRNRSLLISAPAMGCFPQQM